MLFFYFIIIIVQNLNSIEGNKYCRKQCRKGGLGFHTMCRFSGPDWSVCIDYDIDRDRFKKDNKVEIIKKHNDERNRVATGSLENKPSASNMLQMVWDNELARIAQRAADQCRFEHDKCRDSLRMSAGQNIAIQKNTQGYGNHYMSGIQSWFDEYKSYPNTANFQFSSGTGHYTQMVWATSRYLGCARSRYKEGGWYVELTFCNYGPAGNMMGSEVYKVGSAASDCPSGYTKSDDFPGLCNRAGDGDEPSDSDLASPSLSHPDNSLLLFSLLIIFYVFTLRVI